MSNSSDELHQIPDYNERQAEVNDRSTSADVGAQSSPAEADDQLNPTNVDDRLTPADVAAQSNPAEAADQLNPTNVDDRLTPIDTDNLTDPGTGLNQEKLSDFDYPKELDNEDQQLDKETLPAALEALLFVAGDPLPLEKIAAITGVERTLARQVLEDMGKRLRQDNRRGLLLREVEGTYFFCTKPEQKHVLENLYQPRHRPPLSQAAYETLAIIAYNQPVTRAQVESVRGVNSDSIISRLLERNLICEAGTLDAPGRPTLFSTTEQFLNDFGLRSAEELPPMEMLMYGTLRDFEASLEDATGRRDRQISIDQIVSAFVPDDEHPDSSADADTGKKLKSAEQVGEIDSPEGSTGSTIRSVAGTREDDPANPGNLSEQQSPGSVQLNDREVLDVSGALFGEPGELKEVAASDKLVEREASGTFDESDASDETDESDESD